MSVAENKSVPEACCSPYRVGGRHQKLPRYVYFRNGLQMIHQAEELRSFREPCPVHVGKKNPATGPKEKAHGPGRAINGKASVF